MAFELIQSEIVYHGRVFDVRRDEVRLPNGKTARLDVVAHTGAVCLVPVDKQGQVWFVRQYRHPTGEMLLELPAGTLEPGEAADSCAGREIREETGMAAGKLQKIGEFYMVPGYSTEFMHVFLATDLTPAPLPGDDDEFIQVEKIPLEEAEEMVHTGAIRDGKTISGLALARPYLAALRAS